MRGIPRTRLLAATALATAGALTVGTVAYAGDNDRKRPRAIFAQLSGYQEDPNALSTTGTGSFMLSIDSRAQTLTYRLRYANLEGDVTQAHIHLGGRHQSGGISAFLCSSIGTGPAGTQPCPAAPGEVTGTIRAADVIGPVGQGITAGQIGELLAAIRADTTYVNVHSSLYPGGEIRSQLDGHRH